MTQFSFRHEWCSIIRHTYHKSLLIFESTIIRRSNDHVMCACMYFRLSSLNTIKCVLSLEVCTLIQLILFSWAVMPNLAFFCAQVWNSRQKNGWFLPPPSQSRRVLWFWKVIKRSLLMIAMFLSKWKMMHRKLKFHMWESLVGHGDALQSWWYLQKHLLFQDEYWVQAYTCHFCCPTWCKQHLWGTWMMHRMLFFHDWSGGNKHISQ